MKLSPGHYGPILKWETFLDVAASVSKIGLSQKSIAKSSQILLLRRYTRFEVHTLNGLQMTNKK